MPLELRCDAYTATIPASGDDALEWLHHVAPETEGLELGSDGSIPAYCYDHAIPIKDGRTIIGIVRWGGNGGAHTNVELKGSIANEVYLPLRERWPVHACTRMDVAADFAAEGLFDDADQQLKRIAAASRPPVITRPEGAGWNHPGLGRTTVFGSGESDAHAILYDKSRERIERGGLDPAFVIPNWVRFEGKIHPKKREGKQILSRLKLDQALGMVRWLPPMFEAFAGITPHRVELPKRVKDDDRTYAALLRQFGPYIAQKAAQKGSHALIDQMLKDMEFLQSLRGRYA